METSNQIPPGIVTNEQKPVGIVGWIKASEKDAPERKQIAFKMSGEITSGYFNGTAYVSDLYGHRNIKESIKWLDETPIYNTANALNMSNPTPSIGNNPINASENDSIAANNYPIHRTEEPSPQPESEGEEERLQKMIENRTALKYSTIAIRQQAITMAHEFAEQQIHLFKQSNSKMVDALITAKLCIDRDKYWFVHDKINLALSSEPKQSKP